MERGSGRPARLLLGAILVALAWVMLSAAPAVAGRSGDCTVTVDGRALESGTQASAIEVRPEDEVEVVVASTSRQPITNYTVGVIILGRPIPVSSDTGFSASALKTTLKISDYAPSAGLFKIYVKTNLCDVEGVDGWVKVVTASPLDTPAGKLAVGAMGAGALLVVSGAARSLALARRARLPGRGARGAARGFSLRGFLWGNLLRPFIGGAVIGGGLFLYKQQTGEATLSTESLLSWTVGPGFASVGTQGVISAVVGVVRTTAREVGVLTPEPAHDEGPAPRVEAPRAEPPRVPPPHTAHAEPPPAAPASVGAEPAVPIIGATAAPADPPRTSYARLESPDAVVVAKEFELTVGLTDRPDARVFGEPLRRPEWSVGPYVMTIQVVADGFTLRAGETWRTDLPVTAEKPYPAAVLHLKAEAASAPIRAAQIRAMFSVGGQPIGLAIRSVAVVRDASLLHQAPKPEEAPSVDLTLPKGETAPDLTVRIEYAESQGDGRLLMQLLSSVPNVAVPDAPLPVDIGRDPAADLRHVINTMSVVEGTPTQYASLRGVGLTIADQLPNEFWNVLAEVKAKIGDRPPTILILSAEPYVPWELAVVDPPLDPAAPPFLSAQANVGRWVLGQRQPKLPPPATHTVGSIAVVSGTYALPGWSRLVEAEAEAADLVKVFGASSVNATTATVLDLIRANPCTDLIHFAVHGNFDAEGVADGLILVDGNALDPLAVRGTAINGRPFFFLNACQVGQGHQILGDSAGMASAFLFAGASGVIAPLWSIDDKVARTIAIKFYEGALKGDTAADILRRERASFRDSPEITSSTYLAYQYFGHPALRLERTKNGGPAARTTTTAGTGVS